MTEKTPRTPRLPRLSPEATEALARAGLTEAVIRPNEIFTVIAQGEAPLPSSGPETMPDDHYVVD